jgi:glycerol-3-phosphate O-acyltransferase
MSSTYRRFAATLDRVWLGGLRCLLSACVRTRALPETPDKLGLSPDAATVYVLESRSLSNLLVLARECRRAGLADPVRRVALGGAGWRRAALAMSRRRGLIRRRVDRAAHLPGLKALLEAAGEDRDIELVPVSIFWGRRPDRGDSWFKALFSDSWALVGPIRKFFMILVHGRHVFVHFNSPISLAEFRDQNPEPSRRVRKLSRVLRVHFRRQRTATIGPDLSHRRTLVETLLSRRTVREAIQREADKRDIRYGAAEQQARQYAMEIAADYSYPVVRFMDHLLSWLWNRLYDGIELRHFDTVREVAPGNEVIYVPCHRSHIDYLLLSYVLYHNGLVPPHIAAGLNLNLPVIGGILRRGGAFFIRRSFRGNQLYTAVVNEYLAMNFAKGVSVEYFVEGGRSRTGRLLKPREGMLSMTARSYLRDSRRPIVFVPIYIGYEKIIELPSYVNELSGKPKEKESVGGLIKSLGALRHRWGKVYVNVGEPIYLDDVLEQHEPDWRSKADNHVERRPRWLSTAVSELATLVNTRINQAAAVNPVNLLSLALLSTPKHALGASELVSLIDLLRGLLRETPYSDRVTVTELSGEEIIAYGETMQMVHRQPHELGDVLYLDARDAVLNTYFRNNILHLYALPSLIACCFTNNQALEEKQVRRLATLVYPFLREELFLPWTEKELDDVLERYIETLTRVGLLHRENGRLERDAADSAATSHLQVLAQGVLQTLQRFYMTVALLAQAGSGTLTTEELEKLCQLTAQRLSLLHEFQGPDFFHRALFRNFIAMLKRRGLVSVDEEEKLVFEPRLLELDDDAKLILSRRIRANVLNLVDRPDAG